MSMTLIFSSFNGSGTLPRMLAALASLEIPTGGLQIIAVNNGSTDSTEGLLLESCALLPITVLSEKRRGKNIALNAALAQAKGNLIVFTDDDILPQPDWLVQLERVAQRHPQVAIFGGVITPDWPSDVPEWIPRRVPLDVTYGITGQGREEGAVGPQYIWGANMMVRSEVFDSGLRFDEEIGPGPGQYIMGSETEFNIRAASNGWLCGWAPLAKVAHMIHPAQLERDWILSRAYRFGRSVRSNEFKRGLDVSSAPDLLGMPRWRVRILAENWAKALFARMLGNQETRFIHEWRYASIRGYLTQISMEKGRENMYALALTAAGQFVPRKFRQLKTSPNIGSMRNRLSRFLMRISRRLATDDEWGQVRFGFGIPNMSAGLADLSRRGIRPRRIIDGGACKGQWAAMALGQFPGASVLMVEPQPQHREHLRRLCNSRPDALQFAPALLGPKEGEIVDFVVLDDSTGGTGSSVLPENSDVPRHIVKMPLRSLDAVVEETGFGMPDLIKLDVQGYEIQVLEGAKRCMEAAEALVLEVSVWPYNDGAPLIADVLPWLAERGFRLFNIIEMSYRHTDKALVQLDMVFLKQGHRLLANDKTFFRQAA